MQSIYTHRLLKNLHHGMNIELTRRITLRSNVFFGTLYCSTFLFPLHSISRFYRYLIIFSCLNLQFITELCIPPTNSPSLFYFKRSTSTSCQTDDMVVGKNETKFLRHFVETTCLADLSLISQDSPSQNYARTVSLARETLARAQSRRPIIW